MFSFSSLSVADNLLTAEGMGKTAKAAHDDALKNLAESIFVSVESDSKVYQSDKGENYFNSTTQTSSDLALLGVTYDTYQELNHYKCTASMDLEKAKKSYTAKLKYLQSQINDQLHTLSQLPIQAHYAQLSLLLDTYGQYEKYLTVLTFINGKYTDQFAPKTTRSKLQHQLAELEKNVNSLTLAAKLLSKGIKEDNLYIRPARLNDSHSVTPFSNALLDLLKTQLKSLNSPDQAQYFMIGNYQIIKNGILVTYSLEDKHNQILKTRAIHLTPASYQQYQVRPTSLDFDQLLHSGYVVPSDFKAEITTNKGSRNLAFNGGDQVQIFAKLNQPGYLYVVGYINNAHSKLSYLLDIGSDQDDPNQFNPNHFIHYIGPEEAGKWVALSPPFEVCPPYGTESLQLFASDQPLKDKIPYAVWNESSGYYVISKNTKQTLMKTRGFKRIKSKVPAIERKAKTAESVMMISTFKGKRTNVCE
jgi:hypothetical protein